MLVITSEFDKEIVGGLGIVSTKIANGVRAKGYQLTVVTFNRKGNEVKVDRGDIQVFRFPRALPYYRDRQFVVDEIIPYLEIPDLIHLHSVQGLDIAKHFKETYGIPVIYTSHSIGIIEAETTDRDRNYVNHQQDAIYELADTITCPSNMEKQRFILYYPQHREKIEVIPNGIDIKKMRPKKKIIPNRLLYVGRTAKSKGIETLIQSMPLILRKLPNTVLHIVGHGSTASSKRMAKLIARHRIKRNIVFHPWIPQEELFRFYHQCTLVIVPSYYESFGMVMLESMAHGTPVVATTAVGAAENISRSVVLKVPPKDTKTLAEAILRLAKDRSSLIERGKQGVDIAREYTWEIPIKRYSELYRRLIESIKPIEDPLDSLD